MGMHMPTLPLSNTIHLNNVHEEFFFFFPLRQISMLLSSGRQVAARIVRQLER